MDQAKQMQMQKYLQEKNELAAQHFEKMLKGEKVPENMLAPMWCELAKTAFLKVLPIQLRASLTDFSDVMKRVGKLPCNVELSLYDLGMLSNSLEAVSADDLGLGPVEYAQFMEHQALPHIAYYAKRMQAIRAEAEKLAMEEIQQKVVAAAAETKSEPFKPVKAEA